MSASRTCGACGQANTADARFCGRCGTPFTEPVLPEPVPVVASPPAERAAMRTMLGVSLDDLPGAPVASAPVASAPVASAPVASAPVYDQKKTMLGVDLAAPPGWSPPAEPVPAWRAPEPVEPTLRDVPVGGKNRTMLGMAIDPAALAAAAEAARASQVGQPAQQPYVSPPSPFATGAPSAPQYGAYGLAGGPASAPGAGPAYAPSYAAAPEPAPAPAYAPAAAPAAVYAAAAPAAAYAPAAAAPAYAPTAAAPAYAPTAAAPTAPAAAPASPDPAPAKRPLGPSNRTMLGVASPALAQAVAAAEQARDSHQPQQQPGLPTAAAAYDAAPMDVSIAGLPSPNRRGGRGLLVAVLVVGLMVMVGVVASLAWWRFGPRATPIRASVAQSDAGEVLEVELPDAPAGSRARFAGTEQPLAAGRARFPLSAESLHVGDNPLTIDVVAPSGSVETHRVTLTLELRVRADLTTLAAAAPSITVIVEALPGSSATLEGDAVTLDAQGHGTRAYPLASLAPSADGILQHVVRWRVQPPGGEAAEGTLTTRVPVTTIQIDRPGTDVVTDRDRIDIAGAVAPQSVVTIDGTSVPVTDGRFLYSYAMPQVGTFTPRILARAPGRAPASPTITIRRVQDLAQEAAGFAFDATLTYARVAQSPAHFQGQRVAFEGRVYNVDVQGGRSVVQMLVRDCPAGQRCPLWVTYPAATEVTAESWVRVLGTIAGEQQFRSESGQIRTVPRVDATYVLPARP